MKLKWNQIGWQNVLNPLWIPSLRHSSDVCTKCRGTEKFAQTLTCPAVNLIDSKVVFEITEIFALLKSLEFSLNCAASFSFRVSLCMCVPFIFAQTVWKLSIFSTVAMLHSNEGRKICHSHRKFLTLSAFVTDLLKHVSQEWRDEENDLNASNDIKNTRLRTPTDAAQTGARFFEFLKYSWIADEMREKQKKEQLPLESSSVTWALCAQSLVNFIKISIFCFAFAIRFSLAHTGDGRVNFLSIYRTEVTTIDRSIETTWYRLKATIFLCNHHAICRERKSYLKFLLQLRKVLLYKIPNIIFRNKIIRMKFVFIVNAISLS